MKDYPWYDSQWLTAYSRAKKLIRQHNPGQLDRFHEAFGPLRTRKDFSVVELNDAISDESIAQSRELIADLDHSEKETHEIFQFGRLIVHNHPFFIELQKSVASKVSELVGEDVEPTYNFLSLYQSMGGCDVHMDAPSAKWTLDICIDQSYEWPIYISQVKDWADEFEPESEEWNDEIKQDPENHFSPYKLAPGKAIVFSGSSAWHYREPIHRPGKEDFCHLVFFHFTPKGMRDVLEPRRWPEMFETPELSEVSNFSEGFIDLN